MPLIRSSSRLPVLPLLLVLAVIAASGCGDDEPTGPQGESDPWVGSWNATSFVGLGMDLIADGMVIQGTFTATTYSLTVTNDLVEFCGSGGPSSCTTTGALSGTASQITFDAGDPDAVTFNYTVVGNTMTWTGSIEGTPVTITWQRT